MIVQQEERILGKLVGVREGRKWLRITEPAKFKLKGRQVFVAPVLCFHEEGGKVYVATTDPKNGAQRLVALEGVTMLTAAAARTRT